MAQEQGEQPLAHRLGGEPGGDLAGDLGEPPPRRGGWSVRTSLTCRMGPLPGGSGTPPRAGRTGRGGA